MKKMKSDYKNHCKLRDRIKKFHTESKKKQIMKKGMKQSKTPNIGIPLNHIEECPK